jgi:hypothetical protein
MAQNIQYIYAKLDNEKDFSDFPTNIRGMVNSQLFHGEIISMCFEGKKNAFSESHSSSA